jgi:hypothetical protein
LFDDIPDTPLEQVRMIENILLAACEGDRTSDRLYRQLRGIILQEPIIKPLLPSFVRTSVPAVTSITSGPTSRAGQDNGIRVGAWPESQRAGSLRSETLKTSKAKLQALARLIEQSALIDPGADPRSPALASMRRRLFQSKVLRLSGGLGSVWLPIRSQYSATMLAMPSVQYVPGRRRA